MAALPPGAVAKLLNPRSVAVIGATERGDASSSFVLRNLLQSGFKGGIFPVHPRAERVLGLKASASISEIGEAPDASVIALAADKVAGALEEAGKAGCKAAVILASGFAESGEGGRDRQAALKQIAERYSMAVCGPNCLGIVNLASGAALYASSLSTRMKAGPVAIVSHSGASAIALANCGRFGLSHLISAGNGAVTDIPDYLRHLATDPRTRVIGLVVEAIRDAPAVADAMRAVHSAGKRVVVLRAGRSQKGSRATAAHTGALAGNSEAYQAFFRRTGMIEVADMDGFIETVALCLALGERSIRPGLAITSVSGGGAAHVADIASEAGLALVDFAPATLARLGELLPGFATPQNPLDVTSAVFSDGELYTNVLQAVADDPATGVVVVAQDAPAGLDDHCAGEYLGIAGAVGVAANASAKTIIAISNLSAGLHPKVEAAFGDVPLLRGTRTALEAIGALMRHEPQVSWGPAATESDAPTASADFETVLRAHLADHLPDGAVARSPDEAARAAEAIGFPVALKIVSPDIAHKTEAGGVLLGLKDAAAVRSGFDMIMGNARAYAPTAALTGVEIQEMAPAGIEAVVGLVRHPPFGLGMVVGLGGVFVELLQDSAFDLLPLDRERAQALIDRTRLAEMLEGFRGAGKHDRAAFVDLLVALSDLAIRHGAGIAGVDLNPVRILPDGRGVRILDVLVEEADQA